MVQDENGNAVKVDSNSGAMTIEATGHLSIKAASISIEASGTMEVKASGTLTLLRIADQHQLSEEEALGQPAARLGDLTSHGTPLSPGPGCGTVLIDGQPAWRATSDLQCLSPFDGPNPHVGGVVVAGSTTVRIGGLPGCATR